MGSIRVSQRNKQINKRSNSSPTESGKRKLILKRPKKQHEPASNLEISDSSITESDSGEDQENKINEPQSESKQKPDNHKFVIKKVHIDYAATEGHGVRGYGARLKGGGFRPEILENIFLR